ncbi:glycosyltransferase family 1 protein [Candidatus Microgenomates bacterium]|nr:MAG: glycosyltransferase family 1 protein [Candidatus Microgenomates bacterium]
MIIGIDGNEANCAKRVGVHEYTFELLWNIYKLQDVWKDKTKFVVYLQNAPLPTLPPENFHWKYKVLHGNGLWILRKLMPRLLFNPDKLDLFHSPGHYLPLLASVPMVCSVMDLGYLDTPEQFKARDYWQLRLWTAYSAKIAKKVIAISECTKADIVRRHIASSDKVEVTLLGYDHSVFHENILDSDVRRIARKHKIGNNYILFLGTLKPSKNVEGIIDAWAKLPNWHNKINLVIAGRKGWLYENIYNKAKSLGCSGSIVFTGFVPDEDKAPLIKGARAFLIPSFWEGFGLDVLSAMACGIPVIASENGSLPEVAGNAGIFIDATDAKDIADKINLVLTLKPAEYRQLARKSVRQAKKFSWKNTAIDTLKIYDKFRRK